MQATAACGFNGPTALVRNGYWVQADSMARDLPVFVKAAEKAGLTVSYGSADINLDRLPDDEKMLDMLRCFAANGITMVRVQHVPKREGDDVRGYAQRFRRQAAAAEKAGAKTGVRCIIQLHGHCYPHNATAAYAGVQGLDPRYVGVKMDPGNNLCQEGYELFSYQAQLLGEYLAALGAKDCARLRTGNKNAPDKGWQMQWLPADEGCIDYNDVFAQVRRVGFNGPVILMPFYEAASQQDLWQTVKRELQYIKRCAGER